jgi:hypothetical protein
MGKGYGMTVLIIAIITSFLTAVVIGALFWFALGPDEGSY